MLISANPSRPHTKPEQITQFSDNNIAYISETKMPHQTKYKQQQQL